MTSDNSMRFVQRIKWAMLSACILPVSACVICGDYKHIEFVLGPSIKVLETHVPSAKGLSGVKAFPVFYVVDRKGYRLKLHADETTYGPTIMASIESKEPMTLKITTPALAPDGNGYCFSFRESGNQISFSWLDEKGCESRRSISIAILDALGNQVAVEELAFKVVVNGRYCVEDSL